MNPWIIVAGVVAVIIIAIIIGLIGGPEAAFQFLGCILDIFI